MKDTRGEKVRDDLRNLPSVIALAGAEIETASRPVLRPVVNATGIILHTGLGRAAMPSTARESLSMMAGYCNLQTDMETGERIRREHSIRDLVRELTGAEDALLVNNNAGATLLTLSALARNREVIISRGELIEIGGSFRLPEIMEQSGAILRDIGSTNKTKLRDYEKAIGRDTALLLKAHKSNYSIVGFTQEVRISDIADLGRKRGIPVVDDLGCGAMVDLDQFGLGHEMTIRESLDAGSDIVLSSSDKLIGGPQGGLIAGRRDLLGRIRECPLYRTLRVCKMTLAALEATLRLFLDPDRLKENHPVYRMLSRTVDTMRAEAVMLAGRIAERRPDMDVRVVDEESYLGGGSVPGAHLPSVAIRLSVAGLSPNSMARSLRLAEVPVIPHIRDDAVLLNLRTFSIEDHGHVVNACGTA